MVSAQPRDSPLCILLRRQRDICRKVVGDAADWLEFRQILKTPPPKARRVLSGPSTLPADHAETGQLALVWVHSDCQADALRHDQRPCFGARIAPHLRVV